MALRFRHAPMLPLPSFHHHVNFKSKVLVNFVPWHAKREKIQSRETVRTPSALPETAASVAVAATIVGAAATFLVRKTKSSEGSETGPPKKVCEDCSGSGICAECKGEGFVLKRLPEDSAEKARLMAKNMATRYTAGLPKKWSYCTKCSSARSCSTCGGSGTLTMEN